ncbi:TPR end-of-group domain-containing protein [Ktedonospora formicarum]|uniref:ClbS/DfsB family four-helix bundle protein n=1 Tax=Ktedonospora formicarum TaxID=2778364 RepID=A0A8J3I9L6_9CHLR|nr:hypothetical protein [Ktedonospora formicarum]GHO48004.1 hypothetical protein KSX_61670 [Ktedonospora formicarum]
MEKTALQTGLLNIIRQAWKAEIAWIGILRTDEYEANGTLENWSAKELRAHLASWRRRGVEELQAVRAGEMPPPPRDMDRSNAETFIASQGRTWQEVWDESEQAFAALVEQVEQLPETIFVERKEAIGPIVAYGGKHPYRHLAENFLRRGELKQATRLYEEMIEELQLMPLPPQEFGRALYQLACFYAEAELHQKAVEALKHAFRLEPKVAAWLEQDDAPNSLRAILISELN